MSIRDVQGGEGGKTQRSLPKKGPRPAVLVGLTDIGVQQREYQGKPKKPCREIIPLFELTKDSYTTDEGDEFNIRLSLYPLGIMPGAEKAKYTKLVAALDPEHEVLDAKGRGDITKLIGRACFVNVVHSEPNAEGLVYANIKDVTQLPEDYPVGDVKGETFFFDATDPDPTIAEGFSDYVKNHIRSSKDYIGSHLEAVVEGTVSSENEEDNGPDDEADDSPI